MRTQRRPQALTIGKSFGRPCDDGVEKAISEDLILRTAMLGKWSQLESLIERYKLEQQKLLEIKQNATGGILASLESEYGKSADELAKDKKSALKQGQRDKYALSQEELAKRDAHKRGNSVTTPPGTATGAPGSAPEAKSGAGDVDWEKDVIDEEEEEETTEEADDEPADGAAVSKPKKKQGQTALRGDLAMDRLVGPGSRCVPRDGKLALHYCAELGAPPSTIMAVMDIQPRSIRWQDVAGQLPVHLAAAGQLHHEVNVQPTVRHVHHEDTPAARIAATKAQEAKARDKHRVLFELIENYNEGLAMRDCSGRLPLHIAIDSGNWDAIVLLVRSFPSSAARSNFKGLLPYAECVQKGAPSAALEALLLA